jgi:lipid-binding SYLF domain-containing protein
MSGYCTRTRPFVVATIALAIALADAQSTLAASAKEIDAEANAALKSLYESTPAAVEIAKVAKAVLVFPSIIKGGFIIGGQYGNGALIKDGKTAGYYRSVAGSYGLQAGLNKFGYALFFVTDKGLEYLAKSEGWEIGVGPTLTVVDAGFARSLSTTTLKDDIYAFFFDQKGLMAGIGLQGSKISRIDPEP